MRKYNISIIVFYIAIIALSRLAVASQEMEKLFYDAGITWERQSHDNTIIRARYVNINLGLLPESLPPKGQESGKYDVRLNLFNDAAYDIVFTKIEKSNATPTTIWTGHMPGKKSGRLTIAVTNNVAAGSIRTGDGNFYHIGYASNGVHVIKQIDESNIPPELPPRPVDLPYSPMPPQEGVDSGAIFNVMVVYTTTAKNGAGGQSAIESIINSSVSTMNTTFSNSGITPRVNLVHTAEVSYTRGEDNSTSGFEIALDDLTGKSDGYMDNVHSLRDTYKADMVQLLFDNNSLGGLAWLMQDVSIAFESYAFSVVSYNFADGWASDHEFGHNMGMDHDRANSSTEGAYSYSYGYQSPSNSWHTVMAYDCIGGCPRIDFWSNPDVMYDGEATGIAVGSPDEADARTSNNNTAYTVANWRVGGTVIVSPLPDIKANGLDGSVIISTSDQLDLTISLDTGSYSGASADWWLYANTPSGWQYYDLNQGWTSELSVTHQGGLLNINSYPVYSTSGLSVGTYTYYFGVDLKMDEILDTDDEQYYSDSVEVTVSGGGISAPTGFTASVSGSTVTLNWNAVSGAEGYKLYYGFPSGLYIGSMNLGNTTSQVISNVPDGTYYIAMKAYVGSVESGYSNEESVTIGHLQSCENAAGTWSVKDSDISDSCGEPETNYYSATITQTDCNITIYNPFCTLSGSLDGNTFTDSCSYYEDDGGTTTENITLTFSGNNVSGFSDWVWSGGGFSCYGRAEITGSR